MVSPIPPCARVGKEQDIRLRSHTYTQSDLPTHMSLRCAPNAQLHARAHDREICTHECARSLVAFTNTHTQSLSFFCTIRSPRDAAGKHARSVLGEFDGPFFSLSFFQTISHSPAFASDGQSSPHRPRLVDSRRTCPPQCPTPHANSFVIGTAVTNTHATTSDRHGAMVD
jgi:hypothetical protein